MKRYSVITEYKGGIFINQYKAQDLKELLQLWVDNLNKKCFAIRKREQIIYELNHAFPQIEPVGDLVNIWRTSFLTGKFLIVLFIIETP